MQQPVRRISSPLSSDLGDGIEKNGVVLQDREWQVARRIGVAGTDRPQVGVVDQQAAQPDQEARPQSVAVAAIGLGVRDRRRWPNGGGGQRPLLIYIDFLR